MTTLAVRTTLLEGAERSRSSESFYLSRFPSSVYRRTRSADDSETSVSVLLPASSETWAALAVAC